ncbi:MAG: iron-containing alcohol dehydrogenase [Oscillospiraceae bacterium]|nr:iron-containing alcohol dehydrogenase [Oscillospiraceae bacterium]
MEFRTYAPTKLIFGIGKLNSMHEMKMPGKNAMIVISNGKSTKENGSLDRTIDQLKMSGIEYAVFDKIEANPLKSTVMEGAEFARKNRCDFVLALGGGSVMDAAKAIAAMATNDGDLWDYVGTGTGKGKIAKNIPLPVVTITTTAGTGSEADSWGVVTNEETNEKVGFGVEDYLYPIISIVDPELMKTVPPKLTAFQGFDALFHSVECYISKTANFMSDMYAITAIEYVGRYLSRAVKDGNDMAAREGMAFANTLGGIVMTISSCTSQHALEHAMSAYHQDLPHGAGLIMLSIAYFKHFINNHACDDRFIRMAQALGMKDAKKPDDFIYMLMKLEEECNVADLKMSEYGMTTDEFPKLIKNARDTIGGLFDCDRVPIDDKDCEAIFKESYK